MVWAKYSAFKYLLLGPYGPVKPHDAERKVAAELCGS